MHLLRYTAPKKAANRGGLLFISNVDDDKVVEREMIQCCHCQANWRTEPGSGKRRGFCLRCNAVTCGHPNCDVCEPPEVWAERMEGKLSLAAQLHRIRGL